MFLFFVVNNDPAASTLSGAVADITAADSCGQAPAQNTGTAT